MNTLFNGILIGMIIGIIIGVIIGAKIAPDKITNEIGKIKGNGGQVDVDQVQDNKPEKKGLFKRIFTRKNKRS